MNNPSVAKKLPPRYTEFMLLFDLQQAGQLPDNEGCDHRIELLGHEDKL